MVKQTMNKYYPTQITAWDEEANKFVFILGVTERNKSRLTHCLFCDCELGIHIPDNTLRYEWDFAVLYVPFCSTEHAKNWEDMMNIEAIHAITQWLASDKHLDRAGYVGRRSKGNS